MTQEEQIKALFKEKHEEMSPGDYRDSPDSVFLHFDKQGRIREIIVEHMYEPIRLTFDHLAALSKILGTKRIDVDNQSSGGCESCDWDSNYGVNISIRYALEER